MSERPDDFLLPIAPKTGQFLPKERYRQRRLTDGLKLWPLLGAMLFFLPILWTGTSETTVSAIQYLFAVWAFLIVGTILLNRKTEDVPAANQPQLLPQDQDAQRADRRAGQGTSQRADT